MPIRTIKKKDSTPMVDKYVEMFGHLPPPEVYKFGTREEREKMASDAINEGQPIPAWRDRPTVKYGTALDEIYEKD